MKRFRARISPRVLSCLLALAPVGGHALDLDEALRLAEARSPQLAAQRAAFQAAEALVPAAGQNPDPKLVFGVENVPAESSDRWSLTADFMTMRRVGVMQDFVRADKREARESRASAEARREAAMIEVQRADLYRDVATTWFEKHYADRARALLTELEAEAQLQVSTTQGELAGGKMAATEALGARILVATLADRRAELDRKAQRAAALLARWVGDKAAETASQGPDVFALSHHALAARADVSGHPHVAMYAPMEAAAAAELKLAQAATKPDWSIELSYAQRGAAYSNMVSLMVRMDLPLFESRRQDPVTLSKSRQLEQVRAQAEEALRRHGAEVRAAITDWEVARARVERHRKEIVPLVEERARLARAAYEGGRSDLAVVLEARRGAIEARLAALDAEAELAKSWAQLAYLVPERRLP